MKVHNEPPAIVARHNGYIARLDEELKARRLTKRQLRRELSHTLLKLDLRSDAYTRLTDYNARLEADRRFAVAVIATLGVEGGWLRYLPAEVAGKVRELVNVREVEHKLHADQAAL